MLKLKLAAGLLAAAVATSASAIVVTATTDGPDSGPGANQSIIYNFDTSLPGANLSGGSIVNGSSSGYAAPFGDTTNFLVVPVPGQSSGSATLSLGGNYSNLSFYWGSIDTYNSVTFFDKFGGVIGTVHGADISAATGNQTSGTTNRRVFFDFGGAQAAKLQFDSQGVAFELDSVAGNVPEPATWAMLVLGMSLVGVSMRRRRRPLSVSA